MAPTPPKKPSGADTNVLITLSNQENFALEFLEVAAKKRCELFVSASCDPGACLFRFAPGKPQPLAKEALNPERSKWRIETFCLMRNRTSHC